MKVPLNEKPNVDLVHLVTWRCALMIEALLLKTSKMSCSVLQRKKCRSWRQRASSDPLPICLEC